MWRTTSGLLEQLRAVMNRTGDTKEAIFETLVNADVLVLDDLGAEKSSEWVKEQLLELIDHRYRSGRHGGLVVTTNLAPADIETKLDPRIAGRLVEISRVLHMSGRQHRLPIGGVA